MTGPEITDSGSVSPFDIDIDEVGHGQSRNTNRKKVFREGSFSV